MKEMQAKARPIYVISVVILMLAAAWPLASADKPAPAQARPEIMPLSEIKPGMKGVAHTIFAGDKVDTMEVEVVGVMPNTLGPGQHVILVLLKGENVAFTGVAGGMSGSPVYFDGKLAGAISLRFGVFAKEPLAGVTPIENMLEIEKPQPVQRAEYRAPQIEIPAELATRVGLGSGAFLTPIETPLIFSGFRPDVVAHFREQFDAMGVVATHGGTVPAQPDDAELKPGDMVGMVLVQGDLSLQAGCSVTAVIGDRVFVCGHPLFGYGAVEWPMTRGRVLRTLASQMASTKLMNSGGTIGSVIEDRLTAVMGRLGPAPRLIPVELTLVAPGQQKVMKFEVAEHAKLTPLLVAISTFNGVVANTVYGEGMTLQLTGGIELRGHSTVSLENMFAPTDLSMPDGFFLAVAVQNTFNRIYSNPYERVKVEKITLRVESVPERRIAIIENAWAEKSEVAPGERINVKVLLRPYRGTPFIREVPITIPAQAGRGPLRLLISDSESLNRQSRFFSSNPGTRLPGLEQLITLINRERRNHRLYVTLLQPSPTLLLEDKELPNAPISQINVLDQRRTGASSLLLRESVAGEWSTAMNQVITGQQTIVITVK